MLTSKRMTVSYFLTSFLLSECAGRKLVDSLQPTFPQPNNHNETNPFPVHFGVFRMQNPEHLLVFGAGNDGGLKDFPTLEACTVMSGPLGKNSLAVGATSSGPFGGTETGTDGRLIYDRYGLTNYSAEGYPYICLNPGLGEPSSSADQADIDAVAWLSSYGPTMDGRIKPEVVAPGDMVGQICRIGSNGLHCAK